MQRKLFIIRHGKSSWESIVNDIDRPLTERGVKNTYEMAHRLQDKGLIPEAIFSSPAARALHTAVIMSQIWEMNDDDIFVRNKLYLPEIEEISEVVYAVPDDYTSIAIFGHNPGFTRYANLFLDDRIDNIPTAGVMTVTLDAEKWTDIHKGKVLDREFDYPKKGL